MMTMFLPKEVNADMDVQPAAQKLEGVPTTEEVKIYSVTSLNADGSVLEVTFNKPVQALTKFKIKIFNKRSGQRHGVQEVEMKNNDTTAVLAMHRSAEIERLEDYKMEIEVDKELLTYTIQRTQFIREAKLTTLNTENVKDRQVKIEANGEERVVKIPESLDFDFAEVFNKEMNVKINGEKEIVSYDLVSKDKKPKRKNTFIGQYDLNEHLLVDELEGGTAFGINKEMDLERFLLVKDHQLIQLEDIEEGDMLFFDYDEKVAEVYNKKISGELEKVFQSSFDIKGENYEYNGFVDDDRDLETFDADIAEKLRGEVTLYLDPDDTIILVESH